MTDPILVVEDVYTSYGLSQVLFGVSLHVAHGECVCLLGRNGVGKTTTMRSIMGLTAPHRGRIEWKGRDIAGWAPWDVAQAGIGFVPEDRRIFADLTVWENLDVASRRRGRPAASRSSASSTSSPSCASWWAGRAGSSPAASSRCSPSAGP